MLNPLAFTQEAEQADIPASCKCSDCNGAGATTCQCGDMSGAGSAP